MGSGYNEYQSKINGQKGKEWILDLGCRSGYLSYPIAEKNLGCEVIGLDIVSDAIGVNRNKAQEAGLGNLSFVSYDGIDFPFEVEA